nr:MAG TPA: hypothetical protein [Caudoviricetes sp.]
MKTVVLKLEETAIGDFEKLGVYRINLNRNATIDNTGFINLAVQTGNVSIITISNGEFYQDAETTQSLGQSYILPAGTTKFYFKVTGGNPYIEITNIYNILGLGSISDVSSYLFGEDASRVNGYIYTSDLYKLINLETLIISLSGLVGEVANIPQQITDLRTEITGLTGSLADLKPTNLKVLRFRQRQVTGRYSDLAGKSIRTAILDLPLVTGDIIDFLNVSDLISLSIGNHVLPTIAPAYPVTCALSSVLYFQNLTQFSIKRVHLTRAVLLNTLKSLTQTTWNANPGTQVELTTTMSQSDYNSDTEIQSAVTALKAVLKGNFVINFA